MAMGLWSRFDRKTVLYFTGNKDTRAPLMEQELARVGLDDAVRQWQFPTPLDKIILNNVPHVGHLESGGYMNCTMGHYRAIATAYHLGCESVLVMEDDARFLKDTDELGRIIRDLPDDYDLAMLDWFYCSWKEVEARTADWLREHRKVNESWAEFDHFHSGACYALSRRGMERILPLYELSATDKSVGKLRICDGFLNRNYFGRDARMYFARKNAAIQRSFEKSNSKGCGISGPYLRTGIDVSQYAEA